jgi:hypothetical protein
MSDAQRIKRLLLERVAELAQYLFPNGHREAAHWCVGSIEGEAGKSFKICIAGEKAGLWGDFADSENHSRSLLDLWMKARNVDFKTALREAADWAGHSLQGSNGKRRLPSKPPSTPAFDWGACVERFTGKHILHLIIRRGYSREFCEWLRDNAFIGLYDNCIAFPVHDADGKVVGVHYRLKDGLWRYFPQGAKVHPLVIGELVAGNPVHVFESQWDAFAFMDVSGERSGIIITRGARNGKLVAGLVPAGATVYAWKQNDDVNLQTGKRAGDEWLTDITTHANAKVLWPKTPEQFKDLNDWMRAGATADDLVAAMANAEVIQQAEKTWPDALNESVVTSSELHDLQLTPRKKLLGDWFCEGDLGFIFGFRGVGKTWLALAKLRRSPQAAGSATGRHMSRSRCSTSMGKCQPISCVTVPKD